jgi:alpha-glucosidase (family GH31 glycosyl hydrolase)
MEMYTRWIQVGAYSGTMRSHDRGMSGGGCANGATFGCSIVEPWNVPNVNFPVPFHDANRDVLQARATLLPYIYNGHRAAFDTGLGLIRPMYYPFPELDMAYAMDNNGNNVQYMFGPSILFSPVVTPSTAAGQQGMGPGLAQKTTWLPPGTWFDACSGVVTTVAGSDVSHTVTKNYSIAEVPLFFAALSFVAVPV